MPSKLDVDRLEFAILAQQAGLTRIPVIAAYSNHGRAVSDARREFEAAEQRCRQRGLIGPGGHINERVWELIGIYPHAAVEYDLRFSEKKGHELRASVTQARKSAVRTVVDGDRVTLESVLPKDMIPALASVLPERQPARIRPPLSVDLAELRAVMAQVRKEGGDDDPRAIEQALRRRGANVSDFRKMAQILDAKRLGAGELGVTIWDARRKEFRGEQTIRIIDLETGRAAVYNSSSRRMLAGADLGTFNRLLSELTTQTQRAAAW